MQAVADDMTDLNKSLIDTVMDQMEDLVDQVQVRAPVEFSNLRRSGAPSVSDKGATVRSRPPDQRRLSEEELKALSRTRGGGRRETVASPLSGQDGRRMPTRARTAADIRETQRQQDIWNRRPSQ